MRNRLYRSACACMALFLISQCFVGQVKAWDSNTLYYTALGDSIAKGYSADGQEIINYSEEVGTRLEEETGIPVVCDNYAKNGLDTEGLYERIRSRPEIRDSLGRADIITVTIGANDLLNEFKKEAQEILNTDRKFRSADDALGALEDGISQNPLVIVKIVGALGNWDYTSFEEDWIRVMDEIQSEKKDSAQMVVTNIYNPVGAMELPGTLNVVVESVIKHMNKIMEDHAKEYDYQIMDLFASDVCDKTQSDGLHPDQTGQDLIATMVYTQMKENENARIEAVQQEEEETAAREKAAREKAEKEKDAKQRQTKQRQIRIVLVSLATMLVLLVLLRAARKKSVHHSIEYPRKE